MRARVVANINLKTSCMRINESMELSDERLEQLKNSGNWMLAAHAKQLCASEILLDRYPEDTLGISVEVVSVTPEN